LAVLTFTGPDIIGGSLTDGQYTCSSTATESTMPLAEPWMEMETQIRRRPDAKVLPPFRGDGDGDGDVGER